MKEAHVYLSGKMEEFDEIKEIDGRKYGIRKGSHNEYCLLNDNKLNDINTLIDGLCRLRDEMLSEDDMCDYVKPAVNGMLVLREFGDIFESYNFNINTMRMVLKNFYYNDIKKIESRRKK